MAVLRSPYSDVDIPDDVAFSHFMLRQFERHGNQTALVNADTDDSLTFADLISKVKRLASTLWRQGVQKGDVICIILPNSFEVPIAFLAGIYIGATVTTCNPQYTAYELSQHLLESGTRYIITSSLLCSKIQQAIERNNSHNIMIYTTDKNPMLEDINSMMLSFDLPSIEVEISPRNDVAFLPFSSGTTGPPKGVMLTHYNLVANICQASHPGLENGCGSDVYLAFLPFFHVYGLVVILFLGLYLGCKVVMLPKFDIKKYLQTIEKYQVTVLHIVPPIALLLSKHPLVAKYDMRSVHTVTSGAAPLTGECARILMERLKISCIRQGYGMTELSPMSIMCPPVAWKYGAIGFLLPNTQAKVIDTESGAILGACQRGEICVRGPQVMKGYLDKPDVTQKTVDYHGFLHTGDVGYYDEDGHFYVVDRSKELIKYKGYQVAPAEIEGILLTHPSVADAAVVGVPHQMAGEVPKAFVVLKPGTVVVEKEIKQFISAALAPYKQLRGGVEFVKSVPKSPSGKILRKLLRDQGKPKAKL